MPDSTPNINETAVVRQLALALASIYLKPSDLAKLQKGQVALDLLLASVEIYRQASGRPEGWKPSAADWDALIQQNEQDIAREEQKIAALEGEVTTRVPPIPGGGNP